MSGLRVAVIEDSVLLREGLVLLLQELGHTVVAAWGDATALGDGSSLEADVLVTDVRLPPDFRDEGLVAAKKLRHDRPDVAVLVLSQYVEGVYARELLASGEGRVGYLLKDRITSVDDLDDAITRVVEGGTVLDPKVVAQLFAAQRDPLEALTARERDVLVLMAEGHSNSAIAARLFVGTGAVEKHVRSIFGKLGLEESPAENRRVRAVIAWLQRS